VENGKSGELSNFGPLFHPVWVDDGHFNLDYHVRRVACPVPGDHRALCELMSEVYAYQLDRLRKRGND
jgi:diacylglycerol O-acyltransferase